MALPESEPSPPGKAPPSGRTAGEPETELQRLLWVMATLRSPDHGCPWDKEQSFATIAPYTIEEAYEVCDAIGRGDFDDLRDELGDLLFQVVYHARMAEEAGLFDFAAVTRTIADKMIRRHPHVFGNMAVRSAQEQSIAWEVQKRAERADRLEAGTLAGIPNDLTALTMAAKLTARAARVGFDWPDPEAVLRKLDEEVAELRAELPERRRERLTDEVGDLLFVLTNLARKLDLDPETCLRQANLKFRHRFNAMEQMAANEGKSLTEMSLNEMENAWQTIKRLQAGTTET